VDQNEGGFVIEEALLAYPTEQLVTIRGVKDWLQGVLRTWCHNAFSHGEQEEVVIAKDYDGRCSKTFNVPENCE
jgi:hypothetical protein